MTILIVENNPNDEKLALMAFEQTHPLLAVKVLRNGDEAINYLLGEQEILPPRLIMLDLKMPRVSGLEVLRRLRSDSRTRLVPVVILSSSSEPEDMRQAYSLGANSYIRKPLDFEHFLFVIDHLIVYWLDINQTPKNVFSKKGLIE